MTSKSPPPAANRDIAAGLPRAEQGRGLAGQSSDRLDCLARLAAAALGAPIAIVTLLDKGTPARLATVGLPAELTGAGAYPLPAAVHARLALAGGPVAYADAREQPELRDAPVVRSGIAVAFAGIAITMAGRTPRASVCVLDPRERSWTPREIALLADLGAQLADHLATRDQLAAAQALRESEEHLAEIVSTQQAIATAELDLPRVMRHVVASARSLTRANIATLAMLEGDELVCRTGSGVPSDHPPIRLGLHSSLSGLAFRTRELLHSNDTESDPRVDREAARVTGGRSVLCVPLLREGVSAGVLIVTSPEPGRFGEREIRTMQLLAGVMTVAINRAADLEAKQALVAERTAALEALRKREEHFRSLIENASDPIVVVDAEGMLMYATPAYARLLGYQPGELDGTRALDLVHPDDVPRAEDSLDRVREIPARPATAELRIRHRDGSWRNVAATAKNLIADPVVGGIVMNLRDVTDQKLLAAQLRQAQRLEAVGQLAGGVAHDFNNILTVIKVHGELLAEEFDQRDPRREDAEEIRKAAVRAAALTRQLLAFSRQQILQPRVLVLDTVVANIVPMLRRLIGEDIAVATVAGSKDAQVLADPGQLEQVLMNLAVNARDAMPEGGALSIETQVVELDDDYIDHHEVVVPGPYVQLSVSDTGTGMDRRTRERIFEPFFTTKEPGKGTGLGLSTVYGIIKQSGGYVWVYSEPGLGTTFKIYLPLATGDTPQAAVSEPSPAPRGSETVLVVEDEEAVRALARRVLGRQGYTVLEARHGADALQVAEQFEGTIDLVLTDVVMPQMGGRELVDRLAAVRPRIRAVYMSGYTSDDIIRRGILDRGRSFLQKPFTTDELALVVRGALDAPL